MCRMFLKYLQFFMLKMWGGIAFPKTTPAAQPISLEAGKDHFLDLPILRMRIAHLQLVEDRQENLDDCKSCDWGEEENSQELSSLKKKKL